MLKMEQVGTTINFRTKDPNKSCACFVLMKLFPLNFFCLKIVMLHVKFL
jgi:hypothetical protein